MTSRLLKRPACLFVNHSVQCHVAVESILTVNCPKNVFFVYLMWVFCCCCCFVCVYVCNLSEQTVYLGTCVSTPTSLLQPFVVVVIQ